MNVKRKQVKANVYSFVDTRIWFFIDLEHLPLRNTAQLPTYTVKGIFTVGCNANSLLTVVTIYVAAHSQNNHP